MRHVKRCEAICLVGVIEGRGHDCTCLLMWTTDLKVVKVRLRMVLLVKASNIYLEFHTECEGLDRCVKKVV
jgi:hypothetical protein